MSSLLSNLDKLNIRDAIRSVTDTFFVSNIDYYFGVDSLDKWQENRSNKLYRHIKLKALREWNKDEVKEEIKGDLDLSKVNLTFNLEYLQELGLIDESEEYKVLFNPYKDFFETKGMLYEVTDVYYDGALDEKDVLVVVVGKLADHIKKPENVEEWQ